MKKSQVYTRRGDTGMTSLVGGTRVPKTHIRVEAYGTIDELNAFTGSLMAQLPQMEEIQILEAIQCQLFTLGAYLATETAETNNHVLEEGALQLLEQAIDRMDETLPAWRGFILPGGSQAAATCHICRTICRRAERRILELSATSEVHHDVLAYVNRLSDFFFVLSRKILRIEEKEEILWRKH